jgi:hypothetical protein
MIADNLVIDVNAANERLRHSLTHLSVVVPGVLQQGWPLRKQLGRGRPFPPYADDIAAKDCLLRYQRDVHPLAVASIHRDVESRKAELAIEGG